MKMINFFKKRKWHCQGIKVNKLKFIYSIRFMFGSLSNLVGNLAWKLVKVNVKII